MVTKVEQKAKVKMNQAFRTIAIGIYMYFSITKNTMLPMSVSYIKWRLIFNVMRVL